MGRDTSISWTDHTFNIAWGCSKVSPGCLFCYAERDSKRYGHSIWGRNAPRRIFGEKHWLEPVRWNSDAASEKKIHRVFCSSMCDVYERHDDIMSQQPKLWHLIRKTPWLTWQILTKRPEFIRSSTPPDILVQDNVWMGTSAENQECWDIRVPVLLRSGAETCFVSAEPLLGAINPGPELFMLDWVIIGGESGPKRRECSVDWIQDLALDCDAGGVKVWVKQDSAIKPGQQGRIPDDIWKMKEFPISLT